MDKIYLDNAATTPCRRSYRCNGGHYEDEFRKPVFNAQLWTGSKILIENVRRQVADYLHVTPAEIIFTSCGTESNNMIIKSAVEHLGVERIISSPLEHKCVSESILDMKAEKE
jgi:cysteine desulfurase